MKIDFVRSGGFAGLRLARSFDTAQLPDAQAKKIQGLVEAAAFFEVPEPEQAQAVIQDSIQYRLTVSSGARTREIEATDSTMPEQLRPLVNYLVSLIKAGNKP